MRVVASHALQTRRVQAPREMLHTNLPRVVALFADILDGAAKKLGIRSAVRQMAGRAVTLCERRVRFRAAGAIRQFRVADKARDVVVDIAQEPFAIGSMWVVAGGAQFLFDGRMNLRECRQRCVEFRVTAGAERLPLILQDQ